MPPSKCRRRRPLTNNRHLTTTPPLSVFALQGTAYSRYAALVAGFSIPIGATLVLAFAGDAM